jgi:CcmD family protein
VSLEFLVAAYAVVAVGLAAYVLALRRQRKEVADALTGPSGPESRRAKDTPEPPDPTAGP